MVHGCRVSFVKFTRMTEAFTEVGPVAVASVLRNVLAAA